MEDTALDVGETGAVQEDHICYTDESGRTVHPGGSGDADLAPGHLAELPRSLAEVTSTRGENVVEHRLQISPGATAAEVTAAMVLMPPTASLADPQAGAATVLVFHESTRAPG